jgi:molybdopterin molybdotransferase
MVDWSGGNDRGATPKKDAIWICENGSEPLYMRNRRVAEDWLAEKISSSLVSGTRLAIGFDFPFGYPTGFAKALTGNDDPLKIWEWLEHKIKDAPELNNRFDVAAEINAIFDGIGPFWGNGLKRGIPDLPKKGNDRTQNPFPEKRRVEMHAKGSFSLWQLAGAGAVGSQVLMGLPVLHRLRKRFSGKIAVWPFERLDTPVAFLEIWPSLVADRIDGHDIKDAAQVKTLARIVSEMDTRGMLQAALDIGRQETEEGWILGVGCEHLMQETGSLSPPKLTNDCFSLPSGVNWTPVDEALDTLCRAMRPVVAETRRRVSDATGAILSRDVKAIRANPPAANSAVDGYGFAHASLPTGDAVLPLMPGRAAAGAAYNGEVSAGSAIRILTGAILPIGVDTVVLEEDCNINTSQIAFRNDIRAGANTREAGEDIKVGSPAFEVGHRLRSQDLALLTALGHAEVDVFEPLRVGVLSTGDELTAAAPDTPPDQTFDANRPMLLSLVRTWHYEPVDLGHVCDNSDALAACFDQAALTFDAILTTGGASAGEEDHVSALLLETGSLNNWRIALKPGRPLALGVWNGVPVFGLPGNPVAAFTCALIFARPALSKLAGGGWIAPQAFQVPAAFNKRKKPGRREFLRARLNDQGQAEIFKSEGSGRISGLTWSDGFVELPDQECEIKAGDTVRYLPYTGFGI